MKIRTSICCLAAILSFSAGFGLSSCKNKTPLVRKELVKNGDAETESTIKAGNAEFWKLRVNDFIAPNNHFYGRADSVFFSGKHSLAFNVPTIDNPKEFGYILQTLEGFENIPYNAQVTLKAKVKTVNLNGKGLFIALYGEKNGTNALFVSSESYYPVASGTKNWATYELTFPYDYMGITELAVFVGINPSTTGTVYFDEVSFSYLAKE